MARARIKAVGCRRGTVKRRKMRKGSSTQDKKMGIGRK